MLTRFALGTALVSLAALATAAPPDLLPAPKVGAKTVRVRADAKSPREYPWRYELAADLGGKDPVRVALFLDSGLVEPPSHVTVRTGDENWKSWMKSDPRIKVPVVDPKTKLRYAVLPELNLRATSGNKKVAVLLKDVRVLVHEPVPNNKGVVDDALACALSDLVLRRDAAGSEMRLDCSRRVLEWTVAKGQLKELNGEPPPAVEPAPPADDREPFYGRLGRWRADQQNEMRPHTTLFEYAAANGVTEYKQGNNTEAVNVYFDIGRERGDAKSGVTVSSRTAAGLGLDVTKPEGVLNELRLGGAPGPGAKAASAKDLVLRDVPVYIINAPSDGYIRLSGVFADKYLTDGTQAHLNGAWHLCGRAPKQFLEDPKTRPGAPKKK